jgi:hypothetical protein
MLVLMSCAKGTITGGLKTQLLYIKISFPENFNTNFKGNEIKLVFDENVKLKKSKQAISYFTAHEIRTNNITYLCD